MSIPGQLCRWMLLAAATLCAAACGPNYGAVARQRMDQIIRLEDKNAALEAKLKDRDNTITVLQQQLAGKTPRIATLPPERLDELLLPTRVELQRSTDVSTFDDPGPQKGYRVYFRPLTDQGQPIAATGTVTIEAFDLAIKTGAERIGSWTFTARQIKDFWYSGFGLNHFAVNCAWDKPPQNDQITFRITFIDSLTGRMMTDQTLIRLHRNPSVDRVTNPSGDQGIGPSSH